MRSRAGFEKQSRGWSTTIAPRTPKNLPAGEWNAYRLRVGSYRVLYTIEDATHRVVIYRIRHRREVYR